MKYNEYVEAEESAGREPLPMEQWRAELMRASKSAPAEKEEPIGVEMSAALHQAAARIDAQAEEAPPVELDPETEILAADPDPDMLLFWCENSGRVEIMQAGQKIVINNTLATLPHRVIEFTEHHWRADMANPDHREKAEWLQGCEAFRKGEIILVPVARPFDRVRVTTGPRTTSTPKMAQPRRHAGELTALLD